ncbi:hypothetical protein BDQ17DRAFT_1376929 [Cyathus striatus]|nr:hypothetical protein BDQ17DRAFT_1376929 [Cyathus striatus]
MQITYTVPFALALATFVAAIVYDVVPGCQYNRITTCGPTIASGTGKDIAIISFLDQLDQLGIEGPVGVSSPLLSTISGGHAADLYFDSERLEPLYYTNNTLSVCLYDSNCGPTAPRAVEILWRFLRAMLDVSIFIL